MARARDLQRRPRVERLRARGQEELDLPSSDVLQWVLVDGTKVTVRPSGTEPKIKFYVLLRSQVEGGDLARSREAAAAKAYRGIDAVRSPASLRSPASRKAAGA